MTDVAGVFLWPAVATVVFAISVAVTAIAIESRLRRRSNREESDANELAERLTSLLGEGDPARDAELRRLLAHLPAVRAADARLTREEQERLRVALAKAGATAHLAQRVRTARNKWSRIESISLLEWLGVAGSVQALREALDDDDHDVVYFAGQALARFDHRPAFDQLVGALSAGALPPARVATLLEGSAYQGKTAAIASLGETADSRTRFWIAFVLGRDGGSAVAFEALAALAGDDDFNVRANAAQALGGFGPQASAILPHLLEDPEPVVRGHAARAAGSAGLATLAPRLAVLLGDRDFAVRRNAAASLLSFGEASIEHVLPVLDGPDRFARNNAARILVDLGFVSECIARLTGAEANEAEDLLIRVARAEATATLREMGLQRIIDTAPPPAGAAT